MEKRSRNFLQDILNTMAEWGKSESDVRWVGDGHIHFSWEHFKEISKDMEIDSEGYNKNIPEGLVIVGDDWWMEWENQTISDYQEWCGWMFRTMPTKPEINTNISEIKRDPNDRYKLLVVVDV